MSRQFLSGAGWRLGYSPDSHTFQGLVGGDDWALELTTQEFKDFCALSWQLVSTMQQMQAELSDQEKIECTVTTELIEIEAIGYPDRFNISLQIQTGRRAEGSWDDSATAELLAALKELQLLQ